VELNSRKSDTVVECSGSSDERNRIQTQTKALVVALTACCIFAIVFGSSYFINAARAESIILDNRINPNTDSAASLMRLPNIGPSRASAIVEYRRQFDDDGIVVFKSASDLQKVKGIGPKTVEKIEPWLYFE
jgi:competence protein ComEA